MEIWKDVVGYENVYEVSDKGDIRRLFKGTKGTKNRILKGQISKFGYHRVQLTVEGKIKYLSAHRIVAEAFIPNLKNKKQVNHKDGNKLNNCIENLEWVTPSENTNHAIKTGLSKPNTEIARLSAIKARKRKVTSFDILGNQVKEYNSVNDAALDIKKTQAAISQVLRGKNKTAGGYVWKYTQSAEEALKIVLEEK